MHSKPQPLRTRSHEHRDSEPDAHSGPRRPSRQATTPTQPVTTGERTTGRARADRNRSARRNTRPNPEESSSRFDKTSATQTRAAGRLSTETPVPPIDRGVPASFDPPSGGREGRGRGNHPYGADSGRGERHAQR